MSLPDVIEVLQQAEPEPDDQGNDFYCTAHDTFLFDDPAMDFATTVEPSVTSTMPDSLDDYLSESSRPTNPTAFAVTRPQHTRALRMKLRHLFLGCVSSERLPAVPKQQHQQLHGTLEVRARAA